MTEKEITRKVLSKALFALSNETRIKIMVFIRKKKRTKFEQLRKEFNLNNNTLTFHLKKLQDANIVFQVKNRGPCELNEFGEVMLEFFEEMEKAVESFSKGKLRKH